MRNHAYKAGMVILAALLAAPALPSIAAADRVPCTRVLAELNRRISRDQDRDPKRIAKSLDTEPEWVEECLRIHGRRVSGPRSGSAAEEPTPRPFDPNGLDDDPFFPDE